MKNTLTVVEEDSFSSEFSKAHGVSSIQDLFYINGKRASQVIPMVRETVDAAL